MEITALGIPEPRRTRIPDADLRSVHRFAHILIDLSPRASLMKVGVQSIKRSRRLRPPSQNFVVDAHQSDARGFSVQMPSVRFDFFCLESISFEL